MYHSTTPSLEILILVVPKDSSLHQMIGDLLREQTTPRFITTQSGPTMSEQRIWDQPPCHTSRPGLHHTTFGHGRSSTSEVIDSHS